MSDFRKKMESLGADMDEGLKYLETESYYKEILFYFLTELDDKFAELRKLIKEGNWEDYGIKAHAIKSNVRAMGIGYLFDIAYAHELRGKSSDKDFIINNYEYFEREFWRFKDKAQKLFDFSEFKQPQIIKGGSISEEAFCDKIKKIKEAIDDFESDDALALLEELLTYDIDKDKEEMVINAKNALNGFDYSKALKVLS